MANLPLLVRTLRHLKAIQILNRIWRKRLSLRRVAAPDGRIAPLPEFTFLNVTARPAGWNDPALEKLWLYNLHYFDWLNGAGGPGDPQTKRNLVLRWISENPVGWGNGWEPYPTSLRIVNWVKWLKGAGIGPGHAERIAASLRSQVEHLLPRLEYHLLANHLLANAKALVFAGAYLKNDRWLERGLAIYRRELPAQTCSDGVNFERSPMYHCIILEDVLDCHRLVRGDFFAGYARKMLAGLKRLTGPDGKIALFNDSAEGIARSPAWLSDCARRLGLEADAETAERDAGGASEASSGFLRLQGGDYTMIAKCGAIGPDYQPGHAHADTFSFELWCGRTKIVGDTGCSTYVPGAIRSYERSTAAHNTVVVDGRNSSEVWASHRVGRRFDFRRHRRSFELSEAGLRGVDTLSGRGEHDVDVRFHLPPGMAVGSVAIACPGERLVETCPFADGWNRRAAGTCVHFRQRLSFPARVSWSVAFTDRTPS